jgi:two-component system KDP operon response regulator KdpE
MDKLAGKRILIVDDDADLLDLATLQFSMAGAEVYTAADGQEGLAKVRELQPDLVLLDIMMPKLDGWATFSSIREVSPVPIIFLTALGGDEEMVRGLDLGATDYVAKPYSGRVLLARARAALRRAAGLPQIAPYDDGYLAISLLEGLVEVQGEPVELTATEYRLLYLLLQNAGQVLSHEYILQEVWGGEYLDSRNYVHIYIRHLRHKLESDPTQPRYLLNQRGVGYCFQPRDG